MHVALLVLLAAAPPCAKAKKPLQRAECERKAGHVMRALDLVEEWLQKKPKDKKAKKLRDALAAEVVVFDWFSEPEGAEVELDGEVVGPTPVTVTVDPGPHRFRFKRDGHEVLERNEQAISGTHPKLTAVLEKIEEPIATQPEDAPTQGVTVSEPVAVERSVPSPLPSPREGRGDEHSKAPLILLTGGLFVAIGGGVLVFTGILSLEKNPADTGAVGREYAGYALLGVGGAVALGAIIWLLIDRRPGAPQESAPPTP